MTFEEYLYWQAFDHLEPIGMIRENAFQANIAKTLFDVNYADHEFGFDKFMMWKHESERSTNEVMDDIKIRMDALL